MDGFYDHESVKYIVNKQGLNRHYRDSIPMAKSKQTSISSSPPKYPVGMASSQPNFTFYKSNSKAKLLSHDPIRKPVQLKKLKN